MGEQADNAGMSESPSSPARDWADRVVLALTDDAVSGLTHDQRVLEILEQHVRIQDGLMQCLRALALQADRYDGELNALRGEVAELRGLAEAATVAVRAAGLLHSVKA